MTLDGRPAYHYRMCVGVSSRAASQNNQKNTTLRTSSFGESSSLPLKYVAQKTTVLPSNIVRILGKIGGSTNIKAYRIQPNPFFTPNPSSPTNPRKLAAKIREEILIAQAKLASKKSWQEVGVYHASILMFHTQQNSWNMLERGA